VLVSTNTFLSRIATRTGLAPDACGHVVEQTIKTLAAQLDAQTLREFADNLPPTLAGWAESSHGELPAELAPVHLAAVCGGLAEIMSEPFCEVLRIKLPPALAALLVPRERDPADLSAWRTQLR